MSKTIRTNKNEKKTKSINFIFRIFVFSIFAAATIISSTFGAIYLANNSQLSIEFAGGYQVQLQYDGVNKDNPEKVAELISSRIDPLVTSNVIINKSTGTSNTYNVSVSKNANLSYKDLILRTERRGYLYILDSKGHDLLANKVDDKNNWSTRDKRIIIKHSDQSNKDAEQAFSNISSDTNFNSHQPELNFTVASDAVTSTIANVLKQQGGNQVFMYSDIGQLLNLMRNDFAGITKLASFIKDEVSKEEDKAAMQRLFATSFSSFASSDGSAIYKAALSNDLKLRDVLDPEKNGINNIRWDYSDAIGSTKPLSYDTNNPNNVFDPSKPFDPSETSKPGSPMNAWLPYIHDLVMLPEISEFLKTNIVDFNYASYFIGEIKTGVSNNHLKINDDTFNQEKVKRITNLLNAGTEKNNFIAQSYNIVDPSLGAIALKIAIIALLSALAVLSIIIGVYYRFLGIIAILIILLFLGSTLVMFAFLNNIFSPASGIALIISFALLLDALLGFLKRFQQEYATGKTIFNAFKTANKKSTSAAFDTNIIVLIVSLTIFWFGTRSIQGFAIMTTLATFSVITFGIIVFRLLLYFLLKSKYFEKFPQLFALPRSTYNSHENMTNHDTKDNEINTKPIKVTAFKHKVEHKFNTLITKTKLVLNYKVFHPSKWTFWQKSVKWILVAFGVIFLTSGITFLTVGANTGSGFNNYTSFSGEAKYNPASGQTISEFVKQKRDETITVLKENNRSFDEVYASRVLDANGAIGVNNIKILIITKLLTSDQASEFNQFLSNNINSLIWTSQNFGSLSGALLFINLIIAIAVSLITIFIYVIIRFQLVFSIPLILSLIFGVILTLMLISLFYITISTMTIGVILGVMVLILVNTVIIFDNIKESQLLRRKGELYLKRTEINLVANESIKNSLPRTLAINGFIIFTSLLFLSIMPTFWSISLGLIIGSIVSFIATHFLAPWLWTYCERLRIRRIKKRMEKIKKNFVGVDEYTLPGIND